MGGPRGNPRRAAPRPGGARARAAGGAVEAVNGPSAAAAAAELERLQAGLDGRGRAVAAGVEEMEAKWAERRRHGGSGEAK